MHIIPYKRGSEWFQLIIANRPKHEEEVEVLVDVNDIRVFATDNIHRAFNPCEVAILKTPNRVLITSDIPQRAERPTKVPEDVTYHSSKRYTLQWLIHPVTNLPCIGFRTVILFHDWCGYIASSSLLAFIQF